MCGLAGFVSLKGSEVRESQHFLSVLGGLISHRGPDGYGTWVNPTQIAGLAHRRLAIIDLSEQASQPMTGHGNVTVSYNGEIYNYKELRKDAEEQGLLFFLEFRYRDNSFYILTVWHRSAETPSRNVCFCLMGRESREANSCSRSFWN